MNSEIIAQGCRELITCNTTVIVNALRIRAITATAFTALVFKYAPGVANAAAATAGTLPVGESLEYVKSISLTSGLAEVIYNPSN